MKTTEQTAMDAARAWLGSPASLSDADVMADMEGHYKGGWRAFCDAREFLAKASLYSGAKTLVACGLLKAGEYVTVKLSFVTRDDVAWFDIHRGEHGPIEPVCYPHTDLTDFLL